MTLRPVELSDVCREVAHSLAGQRVQKAVQPDGHTMYLGFPSCWLAISVAPRSGRLHLAEEKPAGTGEAAPPFCMLLRKLLGGARLTSAEAVEGERACALEFTRADGRRRLLAFLYGRSARLVLIDEAGKALGAIGPGRETPTVLPPPRSDAPKEEARFPASAPSSVIAAFYAAQEAEAWAMTARTRAIAAARRTIERVRRREGALLEDLRRVHAAADRRRHADLLLAHLDEVPRGVSEVTLPDDFTDGAPLSIPLDPALSAKENAARMYRDHQRRARGRATIESRLAETRAARERAEQMLERYISGELPPPVREPERRTPQRREHPVARPPYREFRSANGTPILVGRGADKNDQLTFHVARGGDLWLHTRDYPGAHVIVPLKAPGADASSIDPQTLLDAATLAVYHSPARDETQADVTYALRKHIRKPKGSAPGLVTVAGGKTLRVRMESERLRRLLATRSDD